MRLEHLKSACWMMLIGLGMTQGLIAQGDFWGRGTSMSGGSRGDQWHHQESREFDPAILRLADEERLSRLTVEWTDARLDELGHTLTVSGRLLVTNEDGAKASIDWQQVVAVILAKAPGVKADWSAGTDSDVALHDSVPVESDGTFSVSFDLRECGGPLTETREIQAGLSLARQTSPGPDRLSIRVDSSCPVLEQSIQMLQVPPAEELPEIIRLIDRANGWPDDDSSAVDLIRAANALMKMPREKAIQALENYTRMWGDDFHDEAYVVYGLIQCAFEPASQEEKLPAPKYLRSLVDEDSLEQALLWPREPMEICDDIPWLLGGYVALGGVPWHPGTDIDWLKRYGVLRDAPLRPADNPLEAADRLMKEPRFLQLPEHSQEESRIELMRQSYAMVAGLLPPIPDDGWDRPDVETHWPMLLEASRTAGLKWDPNKEEYTVRPDK